MLTISTSPSGRRRRSFLKAGVMGIGSLGLADLLRAESAAGIRSSTKAVINIHLDGGPPQMDLIDPKPDAPSEIRGEFKSLPTKIPGLHLTELLPRLAANADKYVFLRSLVGAAGAHNAFQCQSGFEEKDLAFIGGRPAMGCVVSKLLSTSKDSAPAFVDLMQGRALVRNSARPGFLGAVCSPFRPDISQVFERQLEEGMKAELARRGQGHSQSLALTKGLTVGRLEDRVSLLRDLDTIRRDIDSSGSMHALDEFTQLSLGILTSGRFAAAMDLGREDPKVLERYTPRIVRPADVANSMESPKCAQKFLLARRLVEAGVRCVSISISDFDTHSRNFSAMRYLGPLVDHALHTLVTDLDERGMLQDVMIIVWGEFGRTPKINSKAGRDHWPKVAMGIMAGGSLKTGQVIGATDKQAAEAAERPVHYQDVIATLYQHLGIDARGTTLTDTTGRPQYLVDLGQPIAEII
ncbi:DUF1501 domain-containing protein [Prosthecobacter sp.]|uniref:DUF1501 domain-containing protein n=1 Tax=Prosthecobacter sp. TaxID=1965333 RepID=UPI001D4BC95A|nr:DUF1501 domain-containing protein [Prosthecobacter sp.]MCB1277932.1 DUF1501 domain-containing protein [Prosthecobacter sp.]